MKQLPMACSLSPSELEARKTALSSVVHRMAERRVADAEFEARFEPDPSILRDLAQLVAVERECCRFLRFQIVAEEDLGSIWLKIRGPAGTGQFVGDLTSGAGTSVLEDPR